MSHHEVGIAAVGRAAVLDPRVAAMSSQKYLIGDIATAVKQSGWHVTTHEACEAVEAHYATTGDTISGAAVIAQVRRARTARALAPVEPAALTDAQIADAAEFAEIVRTWDCPRCGAGDGVPCTNLLTGHLLPVGVPGHPERVKLAQTPPAVTR